MKTKTTYSLFALAMISLSYIVGGLTIKYELFPYNLYKSQYVLDLPEPHVDYTNKKDLITGEFDSTSALLKELRKGGFVLYLRHADKFENESSRQIRGALDSFEAITLNSHTHPTYDTGNALSDFGQVQSWILNKVLIEELKLPIGKVISSPIKRCRETANIISGQIPETSDLLIYDAILKPIEIDKIKVKQLDLFNNSFADKNNTIIVAHGFPVLERIGIKVNIGQADTLVLKKNSNGTIEVAEWLTISDWVNLLARKIKYE